MRPTSKLFKDRGHTSKFETCMFCQRRCRLKTIGRICVKCIQKVPDHVPDKQIIKYLKAKNG